MASKAYGSHRCPFRAFGKGTGFATDHHLYGEHTALLLGWNAEYRYRIIGTLLEQDGEIAYVFDAENAQAYFKTSQIAVGGEDLGQRVRRMRAIPEEWTTSFGKEFYLHEQPLSVLESQSKADWKMRLQGKLVDTEFELKVTDFETIKEYIQTELDGIILEEDINDG